MTKLPSLRWRLMASVAASGIQAGYSAERREPSPNKIIYTRKETP